MVNAGGGLVARRIRLTEDALPTRTRPPWYGSSHARNVKWGTTLPSSETVPAMRLRVAGVVIAVVGMVMPFGGFAWGLATGDWWPGPTLLNGFGWLVVAAGAALAVVGALGGDGNQAGD